MVREIRREEFGSDKCLHQSKKHLQQIMRKLKKHNNPLRQDAVRVKLLVSVPPKLGSLISEPTAMWISSAEIDDLRQDVQGAENVAWCDANIVHRCHGPIFWKDHEPMGPTVFLPIP